MLGRNFLGSIMALSGLLTSRIGGAVGSIKTKADYARNSPVGVKMQRTRSRFAGTPGKPGDKLGKRVFHGVVTLRNTSGGNYGENMRRHMNGKNGGQYSRT